MADLQNSVSCFSSLWGPGHEIVTLTYAAADELLKLSPFVGNRLAATPTFLKVVEDGLPAMETARGPVVIGFGIVLIAARS